MRDELMDKVLNLMTVYGILSSCMAKGRKTASVT